MKLFLLIALSLPFFSSYSQNYECPSIQGLIKIKSAGISKSNSFCEGEKINISVDGNFDKIFWKVSSDDKLREYSNDKSFDYILPLKNISISFSGKNNSDTCYTTSYENLGNTKPTKRNLLMPDSAYYGQNVTVRQDRIELDDAIYTPNKAIFIFYDPLKLFGFLSTYEGQYRLTSESLNKACGNQDLIRNITYSPIEKLPEITIENSNKKLEYCPYWLMKLNFKAKNLKVVNPIYKVYTTDNFGGNQIERKHLINGNSIYLFTDYNGSWSKIYVTELNSGAVSNILGEFKALRYNENITDAERLLKLIQKPASVIGKGDTTTFIIENKSTQDFVWQNRENLIENTVNVSNFNISKASSFNPRLVYSSSCYVENGFIHPVEEFENLEPKISLISSCDTQAKLKVSVSDNNNVENLLFKWKLDGNYLENNADKSILYISKTGSYQCEIWLDNRVLSSNVLSFKSFSKYSQINLLIQPWANYASYICNTRLYGVTNRADPSLELTNYNWYVNEILQENHTAKFIYPQNFLENSFLVKATIQDGECFFQTNAASILNVKSNNIFDFSYKDLTYEICPKDSQILNFSISPPGSYYFAKYDWYKDEQLIETKYYDGEYGNHDTSINANTPGNYYAIITVPQTSNSTTDYENNTCKIRTENRIVVIKDTVSIAESTIKFQKQFCTNEPSFSFTLSNRKISNFDWFRDEVRLSKNLIRSEQTQYQTKIFTKVADQGNYSAIINYEGGCVAKTKSQYYSGKPKINLELPTTNCDNGVLYMENDWDFGGKNFKYIWKKDGEIFSNNSSDYLSITESGKYQITAIQTDGDCIVESNEKEVIFNKIKKFVISGDTTFCENQMANLFLTDTTNAKIIDWYSSETILNQKKSNIEIAEKGNYKAVISNKFCDYYYFSNPLKINEIPQPTASILGSKSIDYNQSTDLKFELTSAPPWQIKLNTGEEFSIEKSPYVLNVRPLSDMKYSIASVKNICGLGTSTGEAVIKVTILADEKSVEENTKLKVFPIPVTDVFELELLETNGKNGEITLTNSLGIELQNIFTKSINNKLSKTLNVNDLPAGLYNLNVKVGSKNYTRKILKK